ncbi:MAG TPA: hypothetical protein VLF59_00435 [Candidatus Saccharimonadales bacterium]|nr:hypothetical protein [Candidatus Saccharimonadales bacterium]
MARKHGLQPIIENQSGAPGEIPLVRTGTSEADTVSFRVALAQAIDLGLQWAEKDQGVSPDETLRYGIQVLGAVAMHGPAAQLYVAESSSRQHVFTSPIPHIHRAPPFPEG